MTQCRQRLANFEARSVQLIAACTLGLAGFASVPPAHATRIASQATSLTSACGNTTSTSDTWVNRAPAALQQAGKARS